MAQAKLFVADDSQVIVTMIAKYFGNKGYLVNSAGNGNEAVQAVTREKPDLLICDVMMPGIDGYQVVRELRENPATEHLPIIMLTTRGGVADRIAGLQAGADDYVVKPFDLRELELRVLALLSRSAKPAAPGHARVVSVFSLRGGSGVTSLTVNLGVALAQMWTCRVALVDLSLHSGQVPLFLNTFPQYTLLELAREQPEEVARELMQRYLLKHELGVSLLAAPKSATLAEEVTPRLVNAFMPVLKEHFDYVLVDTPHYLTENTIAAFEHTDLLLIPLAPDMASVKAASDALNILQAMGYPDKQVACILNHVFEQQGIEPAAIEEALGKRLAMTIPHEGRHCI